MSAPAPLAPSDPRLARHRYEVAVHGAAFGPHNRRLPVAGPFRFATEANALAYGDTLDVPDGGVLTVFRYFPSSAKHVDSPWTSTCVLRREVPA